MNILFTAEQYDQRLHVVEFEDLVFHASSITDTEDEKRFMLHGYAMVDGEKYSGLLIEFELVQAPKEKTAENIMETEWEWYDYAF